MTTAASLRRLYTSDSVSTASPARLVVMLYDRLVKDLNVALVGIERRDVESTHRALLHAQEIVTELAASLDTTRWPAGEGLLALYDYVVSRLVLANATKDAGIVEECLALVTPLREAFTEAAAGAVAS